MAADAGEFGVCGRDQGVWPDHVTYWPRPPSPPQLAFWEEVGVVLAAEAWEQRECEEDVRGKVSD